MGKTTDICNLGTENVSSFKRFISLTSGTFVI